MSKKILLCGDSFGTTDSRYPNLHFSEKITEKISDCEIINLSRGGASNALIEMQVHQGLQFNPDYAIVLFTNSCRNEYEINMSDFFQRSVKSWPKNTSWENVSAFNSRTYLTNVQWSWNQHEIPDYDNAHGMIESYKQKMLYESSDLNIIKNYFTALAILNLLKINNIPVCFSLGGLDSNGDGNNSYTDYFNLKNTLLSKHFLPNELNNYIAHEIKINLWDHVINHNSGPCFHVDNNDIQTQFASECIAKLGLL
jgi:hypothetical protein